MHHYNNEKVISIYFCEAFLMYNCVNVQKSKSQELATEQCRIARNYLSLCLQVCLSLHKTEILHLLRGSCTRPQLMSKATVPFLKIDIYLQNSSLSSYEFFQISVEYMQCMFIIISLLQLFLQNGI